MEKEFAKELNEQAKSTGCILIDKKYFKKYNYANLEEELKVYNLKMVTKETANEDEKGFFTLNMLKSCILITHL